MSKRQLFINGAGAAGANTHSSHGRRECGRLWRSCCSCLVAGGTICCQRSNRFLLSEHVSPEQSWSLTARPRAIALIRSSTGTRLQLGCSGVSSPFCDYPGLRGRRSLSLLAEFWRLVLSALLRLSFRVDSPLWRACLRGLGPTDPRFGSRKLWPLSWVLPPAAARCCRCFRRWCGCRGLVGRTGLQTSMRTGRPVALKTASNNWEDMTPWTTTHLPPPSPSFLPLTPALTPREDNRHEQLEDNCLENLDPKGCQPLGR